MRRISISSMLWMAAVLAVAAAASATPNPNSAVLIPRVWNDCPASTLTPVNSYPASVSFTDVGSNCYGYANLHVWRFSEDGTNPAVFMNADAFRFCACLVISGDGQGEAGLQLRPWWSESDGRFNVRTTDGEIACFGGRLPFFSFTGSFGLHYVKGTTICLEMIYLPNGLSEASPATIEYKLTYNSTNYTSGPLAFDQGNPAEDPPHGQWGCLSPAYAGGHVQVLWQAGGPQTTLQAQWSEICFGDLTLPVQGKAWGGIKSLYR